MIRCGGCGADNQQSNRFCGACGAPLPAPEHSEREVRKTVTVVFADVAGSTGLGERLDPESMRKVMASYFEAMKRALQHHGGTVEKFIGDAVMAVFGIPQLHEDDALRALRATVDMREALLHLNGELAGTWGVELQMRIGVNTGEVVAGQGQTLATGDAVNVAARLQQAAEPGEVLIGSDTYRLTRDAVLVEPTSALRLKGKSEEVRAFRLVRVEPDAPSIARHLDSPMVGRVRERELLERTFERTLEDEACQMFTVLGSAGVGKSRLVKEFLSGLKDRARILIGRCLAYGTGITFWPVAEVVRAAADIHDDDAPSVAIEKLRMLLAQDAEGELITSRVAEAVGLADGASTTEETFWAIRRFFEQLSVARPLVVLFDDIHWGEPTFLDLLDHIAEWSRGAPLLLLCVARPDLLDVRPDWGGGKLNSTSILLEPLSPAESDELIANVLAATDLDPAVRNKIAEAAEGNPLFVEEMLGMLIEEGILLRSNGSWVATTDPSELKVPPSIRALVTARLDHLQEPVRDVIERASIVGKVFYRGAVTELTTDAQREDVPAHLMTLVRKELIRPDRSMFAGEDAFRFRHILIRDAAYDSMPKEIRAALHERFARWLEDVASERIGEYEEIVAHHLEQAFALRTELVPVDSDALELAHRAARHLSSAATRAANRGDVAATVDLYERAIRLLRGVDEGWLQLAAAYTDALWEAGQMASAETFASEAHQLALGTVDERTRTAIELSLMTVRISIDPDSVDLADFQTSIDRAVEVFTTAGDDVGLARAYQQHALVCAMRAKWGDMEEPMLKAIELAGRAGNYAIQDRAMDWLGHAIYYGPTPIPQAMAQFEKLAEISGSAIRHAHIRAKVGGLDAALGNFDEARHEIAQAEHVFEEMKANFLLAELPFLKGDVHFWNQELEEGVRDLSQGAERLIGAGANAFASTMIVWRADFRYRLGDLEGAVRDAEEGLRLTMSEDAITSCVANAVRGKVAASQGRFDEALSLTQRAIEIVGTTDHLDMVSRMYWDHAEVQRRAGNIEGALEAARRAHTVYERKGHVMGMRRLEELIAELEDSG